MEYWEFLIQKEGDRTWQALNSPVVAIQEGCYRVAVRSSHPDTEIDIRITHDATYEDPPKRRTQTRSRRTNSDGLMPVIPFTHLKPGIWELRCRPDFITDIMGDTWQHNLQLQVFLPSENPATAIPEQQAMEGKSHHSESDERETTTKTSVFAAEPSKAHPPTLRLILNQETYVARQGQTLTLSGRIEPLATQSGTEPKELQICLRDPQDAAVLAELRQSIPLQVPPFSFTCTVDIPPNCPTRLILGEIAVIGDGKILATSSFTVTAAVDELLSAIADDLSAADLIDLRSADKAATLDLSIFDQLDAPNKVPVVRFEPASGFFLPPLLEKAAVRDPQPQQTPKRLELPSFPNQRQSNVPTKIQSADTDVTQENSPEDSDSNLVDETVATAESLTHEATTEASENSELEPQQTEENEADAAIETAEENTSALVVTDRFLSRLTALATDNELSAFLEATNQDLPLLELEDFDVNPAASLEALEIVVDDEPIAPLPGKVRQPEADIADYNWPADEPIPTPELEVPQGELIAGQTIRLRIKLPYRLPQLVAKLWILDLQMRSLLEDPRWVVDFYPNGWEQLEAVTQIMIPFGCLDIRFEAIAIELQTKRESHKVTIDRTIIPPNLPTFTPNELDI